MIKEQFKINDRCLDCNHLGFCQPYWGASCKRQGGKRLPRLKSVLAKQNQSIEKQKTMPPEKIQKPKVELFQPIRTKPANWNFPS